MRSDQHGQSPPLTLVLGPSGSGKTAECLRRFQAAQGRALLLVPSRAYAETLKQRVQDEASKKDAEDAFLTSGELVVRLTGAVRPDRDPIRRTFQKLILADIFEKRIGPEDYFGRMRGTPGFVPALMEAIRELKLSGIGPDALEAGSTDAAGRVDDPHFEQKTKEVARLFRAYQAFLQEQRLLDEEDLVRIAAERIAEGAPLPRAAQSVLVDGFYRFTPLWRALLAALAGRDVAVVVTLPFDPARPLLFATPARTLETLRREFAVEEVSLPPLAPGVRPDALHTLERALFAAPSPGSESYPPPSGKNRKPRVSPASLLVFDAPNPYTEVEMIARALRRAHDERSTPWSRCAIFLRAPGNYAPILSGVMEKYGIPLAVGQARVVAENPLIKTLLTFFRIVLNGWPREDVIAFLKSGYTAADKLRADALRRQAQRLGLRQGRDGWARLTGDLEAKGDPIARTLRQMLEWDRNWSYRRRTAGELCEDVGLFIAEFELEPHGGDDPQAEEDKQALGQARTVLNDIRRAAEMAGRGPITFAEFHREILTNWESASYIPPQNPEAVAVLEPDQARDRDIDFAVVMGLLERVFPRRITEDPFFRDDERVALREAAGLALEERRLRADEERLLFYLAVTSPRQRLILSFPRTSDETDTLPSFYLDEVRALFGDSIPTEVRTLADVAPRPEECATSRDRVLAACAALADADTVSSLPPFLKSEEERAAVQAILETRHLPRLPCLEDEGLRRAFATPRRYRVTEIETYRTCPFQYLARFAMDLRPETEGGGMTDRGTLAHATLRRYFRRHAERLRAAPPEEIHAAMRAILQECLQNYALDAPPHRLKMMERALEDALLVFAQREARYREIFGMRPTHFELAFGVQDEIAPVDEEIGPDTDRDYDPASTPAPLEIPAENAGPPIHLCGVIDRLDVDEDGRRALVLDYKLGNSVKYTRIREGQSLQMPLYLLAVEQLWGKVGAVGCYDSPRDTGRRRFFRREQVDPQRFRPVAGVENGQEVKPIGDEEYAEMMQAALQSVREAVAGIARADIAPQPGEYCRLCPYSDLCRSATPG